MGQRWLMIVAILAMMLFATAPAGEPLSDRAAVEKTAMEKMRAAEANDADRYAAVFTDWAFVVATVELTVRRPGSEPSRDTVKTIQIHRRQEDGSWKIARNIWNTHSPE